jgi:SAM-dependent methyltransferase
MSTLCEQYDADYFERGPQTGKSLYERYRWLPDLTIPMAHFLVMHMGLRPGDAVLDYGCSKGYLVKALRLLGIHAYGCDVSRYAIENADPEVKEYCYHMRHAEDPQPFVRHWDAIISKDVLEHLELNTLELFTRRSMMATRALHVIPLGNEEHKYVCPEYELDRTHIIRCPEIWWMDQFESAGWKLKTFAFKLSGIKDRWTSRYPRGNGFFLLEQ